jgi:trehalose 6-phosphate synthase/phosphatase
MSRLLLVSNRLPVTVQGEGEATELIPSAGGLATALRSLPDATERLWVGWPGPLAQASESLRSRIDEELAGHGARALHLTAEEVDLYYSGFSNGVLWPALHSLVERVRLDAYREWETYVRVNERFAETLASEMREGDLVWVHDYQLTLVPRMLRARRPRARIGYFLHVPFPSEDVFRILPWRDEILRGLLGADVIGFQTAANAKEFIGAAARVLGVEPGVDSIEFEGREIRVGAFPIGIDAAHFASIASDPAVALEAEQLRASANDQRIVLGIDRFDYTKGILRRLLGIERFIERNPTAQGKVRFLQLAVPTRGDTDEYKDFQKQVNEVVGRVNGLHGTPENVPIHFMHRSLSVEKVAALYAAADVMLVTPLRDGMNLVAKEYVACRTKEDGVLVLSEFAGAAAELSQALIVNPYDIANVAAGIEQALAMRPAEQKARMQFLRRQVFDHDVARWARTFLVELEGVGRSPVPEPSPSQTRMPSSTPTPTLVTRATEGKSTLLLDYDGTLVPLAASPELAAPDDDLCALLGELSARPDTNVHIVSGRPRDVLEKWFGSLPLGLHAEHGFWSRPAPGDGWLAARLVSMEWKQRVGPVLADVTRRTVGTFVEEKTASLAWHYRTADPELAVERLRELRMRLAPILAEDALELLSGSKVLEVRLKGIHKGLAAEKVVATAPPGSLLVAIGDDRTDEDMFAALPAGALTVRVGPGATRAGFRVVNSAAVRELLRHLLRGGSVTELV